MTDFLHIPVIPLREAVLFPGVTSPIAAGRPGTLRAIEAAIKTDDKAVFVVSQRENTEDVTAELLHSMGTVATIGPMQRGPSGMRLLLNGANRGIALRYEEHDGYLVATVRAAEEMPPIDPEAPAFAALYRETRERAGELGRSAGMPKEAVQQFLAETKEPGRFADLVAGHLDLTPAAAPEAARDPVGRGAAPPRCCSTSSARSRSSTPRRTSSRRSRRSSATASARCSCGSSSRRSSASSARMPAEDLDELRGKLEALDLPEVVRKEVDRELSRLERMGREGMEAQVIRTYLETVPSCPGPSEARKGLDIAGRPRSSRRTTTPSATSRTASSSSWRCS